MNHFGRRKDVFGLALLSLLVFALGVSVYIVDRPPGSGYMLPASWNVHREGESIFGWIGGSFPSLAHSFSFSVFTSLVLPRRIGYAARACFFWAVLETLFEVGQLRSASLLVQGFVGRAFEDIPVLDHFVSYFMNGAFDFVDVLFGLAGSLLAYFLLRAVYSRT
jgi:hypothetical protein